MTSGNDAAVYGETYTQKMADSHVSLKSHLPSRTVRRRMYGFNIPLLLADEVGEAELTTVLLCQGFCDRTTSHGVPHVYNASSGGKRVFWILMSLLATAALIYHLKELITAYSAFETTTDVTVNTSIRALEFPAITICNNNMVRSSVIGVSLSNRVSAAKNQADSAQAKKDIIQTLAHEYALMEDVDDKKKLGHQAGKMFVFTRFSFEDGSERFKHMFNPYLGNCFTYNHFSFTNRSKTARAGPQYGLWMMLNIEQYEYIPFLTEASGARVLVHDPNEMPFPEDRGITVAPNTLTRLGIRKTEFDRLNGRYGDCLSSSEVLEQQTIYGFVHGYPYSKAACQKSCIQKEVIKSCGCFVPQIPYNDTFYQEASKDLVPPCESTGDNADCLQAMWLNFSTGILQCSECKDPCKENLYDVTSSAATWPSPSYMVDLKKDIQQKRPGLYQDLKSQYELHNTLDAPIKENLLQVEVFYDRMSVTEIADEPKVTDFQFISDLGGSLGLWVGWSMLTLFEFFEYIIDLLVLFTMRWSSSKLNKKTHPHRIKVQETSLYSK